MLRRLKPTPHSNSLHRAVLSDSSGGLCMDNSAALLLQFILLMWSGRSLLPDIARNFGEWHCKPHASRVIPRAVPKTKAEHSCCARWPQFGKWRHRTRHALIPCVMSSFLSTCLSPWLVDGPNSPRRMRLACFLHNRNHYQYLQDRRIVSNCI
jgi:hypothetical protein